MTSFSGGPTKTEARGKLLLPDLVAQEAIPALFCEVKGQARPSGGGHYMAWGGGEGVENTAVHATASPYWAWSSVFSVCHMHPQESH